MSALSSAPVTTIIETSRALRAHMVTFSKSPMLALNPRGKAAFELTERLLQQLEDLVDRVEQAESRLALVEHPRG